MTIKLNQLRKGGSAANNIGNEHTFGFFVSLR